jgi:hypothetical protein
VSQTKTWSFLEALFNILVGYGVAVFAQTIIFPIFGIDIPLKSHLTMGLFFTIISIIRSYSLRRFFNWIHSKGIGT